MQIAEPGNRANPLHIVLPTCLRPFRTTIRNRPATQAAAQAIEPARLLLLSERRGPISRVGNIKPRVGMSILLASIQIMIPRAHRRRLSSILKTPSRRCGSPGYFSYQTNGLPHLTHGVRNHIVATQQKTTRKKRRRNAPQRKIKTGRKCHNGASLQRNHSELSENAARGPLFRLPMTSNPILRPQNRRSQISSTPNSPFRPNNMPAMRPPCGISWQKRPNKTQHKV